MGPTAPHVRMGWASGSTQGHELRQEQRCTPHPAGAGSWVECRGVREERSWATEVEDPKATSRAAGAPAGVVFCAHRSLSPSRAQLGGCCDGWGGLVSPWGPIPDADMGTREDKSSGGGGSMALCWVELSVLGRWGPPVCVEVGGGA